jgi:hypothetical protein
MWSWEKGEGGGRGGGDGGGNAAGWGGMCLR